MASQDGFTALIAAAWEGHRDTVEVLLDGGADLEAKNGVSQARRMLLSVQAARGRRGRAVDNDGVRECGKACWVPLRGEREVAPVACREGCGRRWHLASQRDFTALMIAAEQDHKNTVELLLDRGAVLEAADEVSRARVLLHGGPRAGVTGGPWTAMAMGAVAWRAGCRWVTGGRWCQRHCVRAVVVEGTWPRRMASRR